MKLIEVESSMIQAVGYDQNLKELQVVFNSGNIYCYTQVPKEEYESLLNADSKGSYMRANIIDTYPYYPVHRRRRRKS
jgi:hypothetical protein